jgi:hypothetical protein
MSMRRPADTISNCATHATGGQNAPMWLKQLSSFAYSGGEFVRRYRLCHLVFMSLGLMTILSIFWVTLDRLTVCVVVLCNYNTVSRDHKSG